jgi:hypothetical protein
MSLTHNNEILSCAEFLHRAKPLQRGVKYTALLLHDTLQYQPHMDRVGRIHLLTLDGDFAGFALHEKHMTIEQGTLIFTITKQEQDVITRIVNKCFSLHQANIRHVPPKAGVVKVEYALASKLQGKHCFIGNINLRVYMTLISTSDFGATIWLDSLSGARHTPWFSCASIKNCNVTIKCVH